MSRVIDLSHPLEDGQMSYPSDLPIRVTPHRTMEEHGVNVSSIKFAAAVAVNTVIV